VSSLVVCVYGYCRLIPLVAWNLPPLPPGQAYGGPTRDTSNKCECSTVGYSLISACVTCQEEEPLQCDHIVSSQFPGAHGQIHASAGLNMWSIAHLLCLLRSESSLGVEKLLHLTLKLVILSTGSQTLSLQGYMFLTGLFLMSRFV
jgi:hypothetical protein